MSFWLEGNIWWDHLIVPPLLEGLPGGSAGKEYTCAGIHECRRPGFSPWVGKTPWRRERLFTPVLWPGEFHGFFHGVAQSWTHWATFASPHLLESVLLWHVPNSFKFSPSLRDVLRGDGSCRRHEAGHLCPWARTQARAIRGFTSSHPGQHLNPLAYRQAGVGRASPGASSGRFSPRKFSSF